MFALVIAIGALFLAVVVSAAIDPWPGRADDVDDASIMDGIAVRLNLNGPRCARMWAMRAPGYL
jgi:hypothetical protein